MDLICFLVQVYPYIISVVFSFRVDFTFYLFIILYEKTVDIIELCLLTWKDGLCMGRGGGSKNRF